MKNLFKIISVVLFTIIFSCNKDETAPTPTPEIPKVETVYVGGFVEYANGIGIPTIWTNGIAQSLPITAGNEGDVKSIFVDGNDIYAVGYEYAGNLQSSFRAVMWKNGVKTMLSISPSSTNAIYVANGIPYIVGNVGNIATLWYKSNLVSFQFGMNGSTANGVSVKGNDVYIVGINEQGFATQWKNNGSLTAPSFTANYLSTESSSAVGISILDNNVYIAGKKTVTNFTAQLWKNNVSTQQFADNTQMISVFAKGQDVFATGAMTLSPFKAMLWKNNQPTQLSQNLSIGYSVYATTNNNYVAGFEVNPSAKACIWKNGVQQILSDNLSLATSVFATEK